MELKYLKELLHRLQEINKEQNDLVKNLNDALTTTFADLWCVNCKGAIGKHECDNCEFCGTAPKEDENKN